VRPTRHRRRFHTDRIVRNRRARYLRETPDWHWRRLASNHDEWIARLLAYGTLASRDPWDCGNPGCWCCHPPDSSRRARENRQWRKDWGLI
jgi:hypothetical protein